MHTHRRYSLQLRQGRGRSICRAGEAGGCRRRFHHRSGRTWRELARLVLQRFASGEVSSGQVRELLRIDASVELEELAQSVA